MIYEANLDIAPMLQILMNLSEILHVALDTHNEAAIKCTPWYSNFEIFNPI